MHKPMQEVQPNNCHFKLLEDWPKTETSHTYKKVCLAHPPVQARNCHSRVGLGCSILGWVGLSYIVPRPANLCGTNIPWSIFKVKRRMVRRVTKNHQDGKNHKAEKKRIDGKKYQDGKNESDEGDENWSEDDGEEAENDDVSPNKFVKQLKIAGPSLKTQRGGVEIKDSCPKTDFSIFMFLG
eukprot:5151572-Amphidinium_carterae.1